MGTESKDIVEKLYTSLFNGEEDLFNNFLHPNVNLTWYGTTGVKKLNFEGILALREDLVKNFTAFKAEIEKTVEEDNQIAIEFTYYVETIENPDEEVPLAHFMAIWELKDNKLYKGVQISQPVEDIDESSWA
jgi:hypothetical protein